MKAARLRGIRDVVIEEIPVPEPGPGEARVRLTRVGMCGSDVHYYSRGRIGNAVAAPGHIAGHEPAGVIDKLGDLRLGIDGEAATRLRPGARVAVEPAINCELCECCLAGHPNQCPNGRFISSPPHQGAFTEYICHPVRLLVPVPDDLADALTDEDLVMLEPLGVGIYAVRRGGVRLGDTVAVFGCGPIGLSTIQCARSQGASRVFATDVLDYRLEYARRLGANEVMNASAGDVVEWVKSLTGGRGADVVFDCAGEQDTVDHCIHGVRYGGRVALVGAPEGDRLSYEAHFARRKELDLVSVRRSLHGVETGLAMVRAGQADLRTIVTHRFPLDEITKAYDLVDRYADGVVKAMVVISEA